MLPRGQTASASAFVVVDVVVDVDVVITDLLSHLQLQRNRMSTSALSILFISFISSSSLYPLYLSIIFISICLFTSLSSSSLQCTVYSSLSLYPRHLSIPLFLFLTISISIWSTLVQVSNENPPTKRMTGHSQRRGLVWKVVGHFVSENCSIKRSFRIRFDFAFRMYSTL